MLSRRSTQHAPFAYASKVPAVGMGTAKGWTLSGVLCVHTVSGKKETPPWNLRLKARRGEMKNNQEE